jgi:mannose-6-phosphate isomerase-like protein (cupin superfamily)
MSAPVRVRPTENEVSFPSSGERFVFLSPDGEQDRFRFDFFVAPGGGVFQRHCHTGQVEWMRCVEGSLDMVVDGTPAVLRAGEEMTLEPGTFHSLANTGDAEAHCEVEYRPAGRNREWFRLNAAFEHCMGRAPGLLDIAPFLPDVDMYVPGPPRSVQRALFVGVLRPLAVLLGRRRRMLRFVEDVYGRPLRW